MRKPFHRKATYCRALDRSAKPDLLRDTYLKIHTQKTIDGYVRVLAPFAVYAARNGFADLPADSDHALSYMLNCVDEYDASYTEMLHFRSALNCLHVSNRYDAVSSPEIRAFFKRLERDYTRNPAPPFSEREVYNICDYVRENYSPPRAARDCGMVLTAWRSAERPIEYSNGNWEHIEIFGPGSASTQPFWMRLAAARSIVIKIPFSKTDQGGNGHRIGIEALAEHRYCPIKALSEWARLSGRTSGAIFPRIRRGGSNIGTTGMRTSSIRRIIAEYASVLKTKGKSPYGLRRGIATHLDQRGVARKKIKELLRHELIETTGLYCDEPTVRWSSNPARGFLE